MLAMDSLSPQCPIQSQKCIAKDIWLISLTVLACDKARPVNRASGRIGFVLGEMDC